MPCCRGQNYDLLFNRKTAAKELRRYKRRGPVGPTRRLLQALRSLGGGVESLLDIGGGVGVLQHELALEGASVVAVDASVAYLEVIRNEARARGYSARQTIVEGDFVDAAKSLEPTDVVTLDKVICCYPDMPALVSSSAAKARRAYGIVIPRDSWWVRLGAAAANLLLRLLRWKFRAFVHPHQAIDAVLNKAGLRLRHHDAGLLWVVRVYERHIALFVDRSENPEGLRPWVLFARCVPELSQVGPILDRRRSAECRTRRDRSSMNAKVKRSAT